jgi:hypothetical protein
MIFCTIFIFLNFLSKLRGILKKECKEIGMKNYWILDGAGAISSALPGKSAGSATEMLSEIKPVLASDGVHLTTAGNRNLASNIVSAITGLKTGTLRSDSCLTQKSFSGKDPVSKRGPEFFWRGFVSPTGDLPGRAANPPARGHSRWGRPPAHKHAMAHPYHRRGR